ncbi:MAG: hypothetical protein IKL44_05875 [Clostridia bacterium]|nr:hypothetical protein [Clostridia bacterium]
MRKVVAAVSSLTYLAELALCISSIIEFGIARNFAIFWVLPFVIQFACYMVILFQKTFSNKIAIFVTIFGFVLSIPVLLLSLPEILYWILPVFVSAVLSLIFLCFNKRN